MYEEAEHPHQAAIHLMKSIKCCKQCSDVNEVDLRQIQQLEYRKQRLAQQLKTLNYRGQSVHQLKDQVKELERLVFDLRNQNVQVQRLGIEQINRLSSDRHLFENQQREGILVELNHQKNLTQQLSIELQGLLERVKYLNRMNNQLIYNFCTL